MSVCAGPVRQLRQLRQLWRTGGGLTIARDAPGRTPRTHLATDCASHFHRQALARHMPLLPAGRARSMSEDVSQAGRETASAWSPRPGIKARKAGRWDRKADKDLELASRWNERACGLLELGFLFSTAE